MLQVRTLLPAITIDTTRTFCPAEGRVSRTSDSKSTTYPEKGGFPRTNHTAETTRIRKSGLVRRKAGSHGQTAQPGRPKSGKAVYRTIRKLSEDNGKAAKEYREHQEALKRKEVQRIAEGCGECQVTKRRKRKREKEKEKKRRDEKRKRKKKR